MSLVCHDYGRLTPLERRVLSPERLAMYSFGVRDPRERWSFKRVLIGMSVGDFIPHWDPRWRPLDWRPR